MTSNRYKRAVANAFDEIQSLYQEHGLDITDVLTEFEETLSDGIDSRNELIEPASLVEKINEHIRSKAKESAGG